MTLRVLIVTCCFTLSFFTQAAPSESAEADYQKALVFVEQAEAQFDRLIALEQSAPDKAEIIAVSTELSKTVENIQNNLRKASDGGHPVASYLLASSQKIQLIADNNTEACRLYQKAADEGLLAGAVAVLRSCENTTRRFVFDSPELERLRIQLRKALNGTDAYRDYYPLPAQISFCFKAVPDAIPVLNSARPFSQLKEMHAPAILSFEQFRADGYYLLAIKAGEKNPPSRSDVDQALAKGCIDPLQMDKFVKSSTNKPLQEPVR